MVETILMIYHRSILMPIRSPRVYSSLQKREKDFIDVSAFYRSLNSGRGWGWMDGWMEWTVFVSVHSPPPNTGEIAQLIVGAHSAKLYGPPVGSVGECSTRVKRCGATSAA